MNKPMVVFAATVLGAALSVVPATASLAGPAPNTADVECTGIVTLPAQDGSTVTLPAHNGSTDCFLVINDSGSGVRALQTALRLCNLKSAISIDGLFGNQTRSAVIAFQKAHGLTADGGYGNNTRNAMLWPDNDTTRCTPPTHF